MHSDPFLTLLPRRWRSAAKAWLLVAPTLLLLGSTALQAQQRVALAGGRVSLPASIRPVAPVGSTASATVPAALTRTDLTAAESAEPMRVEVVLKMRNFAELQRRVAAGERVSRSEMAARYLPLESDYQAVAQWASTQGLTVAAPGAGHTMVIVHGTPIQLKQAFQTTFARVTAQGKEYTAAIDAPSLPAGIESRVSSIHGLQPYLHPRKSGAIKKAVVPSTHSPPYLVSDILNAYDVPASGLTGAGQQIGIIIDTVPNDSDLTKFWSDNGIAQSLDNITTVDLSDGGLPPASGEETLDVSWSSGIASGAQVVIYASGDLSNVNAAYSRIIDDLQSDAQPNLHQISMSYGAGEVDGETSDDVFSTNEMFTVISAYGVTLFASSGDNGSYGNGGSIVETNYPASDPNVTSVGGTSLYLNSTTGAVSSETAWSVTGRRAQDSSGGGVSVYFSRPSWQKGNGVPSGTMRLVPDVALAADPNTGCYLVLDGQVDQYGGTSWSSPSWAGLCALINQARAATGRDPLGAANYALYPQLGTSSFRDIISGSNGVYSAGVGYDLVTGIGVPDFNVLLPSLVRASFAAPAITSALTASGTVGSAFTYQITASNAPTAYSADPLPPGLTINPATGVISGTLPATPGSYDITLGATNDNGTGTATLTLTVTARPPVITSATVANVTTGDVFTYQITASNAPTFYAADPLPAGLAFNPNTGVISGKVTAVQGFYLITLGASNSGGAATGSLSFNVAAPVLPPVTLTATAPQVSAGSGQVGAATLTIPTPLSSNLIVYYTLKGSAKNGEDYVFRTGHATLKAGKTSKVIKITPAGDLGGANKKAVKITLAAGSGYTIATPGYVKITITGE